MKGNNDSLSSSNGEVIGGNRLIKATDDLEEVIESAENVDGMETSIGWNERDSTQSEVLDYI